MAIGATVEIADPDDDRAAAAAAELGCGVAAVEIGSDPTAHDLGGIVIASPSVFHCDQTLSVLKDTQAKVLVEKPLALPGDRMDDLVNLGGDRIMVGYNLRLHRPVERLIELVEGGRIGHVHTCRLWFGSWLPDWRPGVDYRTTYSAQSSLGGGVLLDAIHELDLAIALFGDGFEVLSSVVENTGALEIDTEDLVQASLRHDSGVLVNISLDYLSRRYRRGIEIVGSDATARLDWARAGIEIEDADQVVVENATVPVDRSYEREASRFLEFIKRGIRPPVDAETGAASVRLAQAIRQGAK